MFEFWYNYVKAKYNEVAKLCYMDTDNFIVQIKKMIFTKTLQKILKQGLTLQIKNQTENCLKEGIKKVIGLMKDKLDGKIIKKFV